MHSSGHIRPHYESSQHRRVAFGALDPVYNRRAKPQAMAKNWRNSPPMKPIQLSRIKPESGML